MSTVIDERDERIAELEEEVAALKERIREQGTISKAKGFFSERLGFSEPEAHRLLQKLASNTNARLQEVAAWLCLAVDAVNQIERERAGRRR